MTRPSLATTRSLGLPSLATQVSIEAASGIEVARVLHNERSVRTAGLPCSILAMNRIESASRRTRDGVVDRAPKAAGGIGVIAEGDSGTWEFERVGGATNDVLHLYMPRGRLSAISQQADGPAEVTPDTRMTLSDPVLATYAQQIDAAIEDGAQGRLYLDSLVMASVLRVLGLWRTPRSPYRGGLAPWQLKRACDAMMARLHEDLGLDELAAIVGCSPTHFSRAFKQSTGQPPSRWLLERRVERAKALLREGATSLADVALAVGFSAQPQFTTAFGRVTGMTPGRFRREARA